MPGQVRSRSQPSIPHRNIFNPLSQRQHDAVLEKTHTTTGAPLNTLQTRKRVAGASELPPSASTKTSNKILLLLSVKKKQPHLPPPIILLSASRCSCTPESFCSLAAGKVHGSDLELACAATLAACGEFPGRAGRPKTAWGRVLLLPSFAPFGFAKRLAGD